MKSTTDTDPTNIILEECYNRINEININKFKDKNVLILGGNSFLASYICSVISVNNQFKELNCSVDLFSKNKPKILIKKILKKDKKFKFKILNFHEKMKIHKYFKKKYDFIFFCLTYGQPALWMNNQINTIWINTDLLKFFLLKSKKENSILLYFSSCDIYGETKNLKKPVTEDDTNAVSLNSQRAAYGESKRLGEVYCNLFRKNFKTKVFIVRPAHTYGPGMDYNDRRVIVELIKKGLKSKKINLLDEGKAIKTYGYIFDVVKMFFNIIQFGKYNVYNTTGNNFISIYKLAQKISIEMNIKYNVTIKKTYSKKHIGTDPEKSIINSTRAYKEFNILKLTPLDVGIKNLIYWLKLNKKKYD